MNENNPTPQEPEAFPEAVLVRRRKFTLIWVVPLIAVLITAYLVYDTYSKRGPDITITFKDGDGLVAGKTQIQYLGVQVGLVKKVHLDPTLSTVVVEAELDQTSSGLAVAGSNFWVVRPSIGIGGVRGLDTLLSGPYIAVSPGPTGGQTNLSFTGLDEPPAAGPSDSGLNLILQADKLGSLHTGAPIYYREFQVGAVDQVALAADAQSVHVFVHIDQRYVPLIRQNTRFWNASGIGMSLGLFGAKVKTESLSSLLTGGLALATPPEDQMGPPAEEGAVFELHDDPKDEWLAWSPSIPLQAASATASASSPDRPKPSVGDPSSQPTVAQPAGTGTGSGPPAPPTPPPMHGPHH